MGKILLALALLTTQAFAVTDVSSAYIKDIESLLNSVDSHDSSRPQLVLKLADALYNDALDLSGHPDLTSAQKQKITADRRRAILLYQDALTGLKGLFPLPNAANQAKIKFQLARINNDMGDSAGAEKLWVELSKQEVLPEVERESLLRLAEVYENRNSAAALSQAEANYKKALTLCASQEVCSYTHYRLAWVYQRQDRTNDAVAEMDQALWDAKGQVREESLRDMMSFLGGAGDDGHGSLEKIEKLSAKTKRPQLIGDLAEAYFAHGNRKAGVYVLEAVNRKTPSLKAYVRLMEEDYGFRDWTKFSSELDGATELGSKTPAPDAESEKILRRLTVQLDGERGTNPQISDEFRRTVMLYLTLYPGRPERTQMIDGWLNSQKDENAKMAQLKIWIDEELKAGRAKEEERLRRMRASLAQKTQKYPVVIAEMQALSAFATTPAQKREAAYQVAYAQYLNKNYDAALTGFNALAATEPGATYRPDKWAIQSENLSLDILGKKKDYAAVVKQAKLWTTDPRFAGWLESEKTQKDEMTDIQKVAMSAQFEYATSLGNTPEALAVFLKDCEEGKLLPKSCANAQIVAVKTGNQTALIAVLKKLGKKDELAAELEASAEFLAAAGQLEANLKGQKKTVQDDLKIALLYELGGSLPERDRVLKSMVVALGTKPLGAEEDLILQTLKDANLITAASLKMGWKKDNREYLMSYLATHGQMTADIQNQMIKSCHDMGPAWGELALKELNKLDEKQRSIHFSGKNSKRKFEMRVAGLKTLNQRGDCYMQSTTAERRVVYASLLARAEQGVANEIKASPIPDGVDEAGKAQLEKALGELAQPFSAKAEEFNKLAQTQLDKVENGALRENLSTKLKAGDESLYAADPTLAKEPAPSEARAANPELAKQALDDLHKNPSQKSSLSELKSYYEASGKPRLAAYFQGRLLQLKGDNQQ